MAPKFIKSGFQNNVSPLAYLPVVLAVSNWENGMNDLDEVCYVDGFE